MVEDWEGKIILKSIHSPLSFLRADQNGEVDLADRPRGWETWIPFENASDGSWSFLSYHGTWLSANKDNTLKLSLECQESEHFFLECW